jgi:Abnormal spindle-like microcephaly-assoc'd, ASPM-SPD-2-Hydin/Beta-propeller repeat
MRLNIIAWAALAIFMGSRSASTAQQTAALQTSQPASSAPGARVYERYGTLPLTFEPNQGQTNSQVRFISRGRGYTAFLTAGGIVLSLHPNQPALIQQVSNGTPSNPPQQPVNATLQLKLLGAAPNPAIIGEDAQPGKVNYFIGRDPRKWHTNVPTYARVRYKNVYPGIDLVYYGNHQQLEYDFAISPEADPGLIQYEITGASQINLDAEGNLVLQTGAGELHFQSPLVYQESNGLRMPVPGAYVVNDSTHIGFAIAQHDQTKVLVIDPTLVYSTYVGGAGDDQLTGIAVDGSASIYLAGYTDSADFLLTTLGTPSTNTDHVFVAKLDPTGSRFVYADYIGGSSADYGVALALDSGNNVYVTGSTTSSDFPTVNPYQASDPGSYGGFVTKISADGSSLVYSTYLGGSGFDQPTDVAVDTLGEAYVAGSTASQDFPMVNAYQNAALANQGGLYGTYGFITKFTADGSSLSYSTYLAGNQNVAQNCGNPCWPAPYTTISAVTIDANGSAYVAGTTNTSNFPATSGAYLTTNSTQPDAMIGFVSKFASAGTLDYSTYFYGASGNPVGIGDIAVDGSGSAYIAGTVSSDGTFPITSTSICDPGLYGSACSYAFVSKFDPTASTLLYSSFLGPDNYASPQSIAVDASNNAYVLATTESATFGTNNGIEGYANGWDMLLVKLDPSATTELLATYLGARGNEFASGMALDANGNIYVAGSTDSADFPVTQGAFQSLLGGNTDGFVMKIDSNSAPAVSVSPNVLQYAALQVGSISPAQTVLLRNMGSSPLSISLITTTGDFAETNSCGTSVAAAGTCTFSITFAPTTEGSRLGTVVIQDNAAGSPHFINLSGSANGLPATLNPASLTFSSQQVGSSSATQIATLSNGSGGMLTITNIQATGDFAQTNNCPAQLPGGSSCTISVTFNPTVAGARSGALTISDDAVASPQIETLTGSGSDFSLTSSPNSDAIKAGSAANYTLTVSPLGGSFSSAVKLTCSGLPAQTSCSLSPTTVTPGASTASTTLSIATTASTAQAPPLRQSRGTLIYAVWFQLHAFGLLGIMLIVSKAATRKQQTFNLTALLTMALILMTACAGGTGIAPPPQTGTAPGTYAITVTGTSANLQHSLPVTLTVQ